MKRIFILVFLITLFSCNDQVDRPANILDEEKMATVLIDVELLEAVVKQKVLDRKYPKKNVPVYYRQVLEKHNLSYEQFEESYTWWKNHPKLMKEIYDDVHKRLEFMKEGLPDVEKKNSTDKEKKKD